ncbi:hypothetical protein [Paenibacillus protaetiae]|uniref:Uncharacterized protein n=1 Tax=Paenibacillus protaetiae TaxID=2509456 RepID=A0A4P6F3R1_9BACL|nr:hypothetical protein [Paenibacillus protaetiae]QAY67807.1 hypothetical protein ET464_16840 [Paenibacillus protaetiae]
MRKAQPALTKLFFAIAKNKANAYEVVSRYREKQANAYEVVSRYREKQANAYEVVFRYREKL